MQRFVFTGRSGVKCKQLKLDWIMKMTRVLGGLLLLACVFVACQKENEVTEPVTENGATASMKLYKSAQVNAPEEQQDFKIVEAGIYENWLYLNLEYTGGEKQHQFDVVWDGNYQTDGDRKIITLTVAHLTTGDLGTEARSDSLTANLKNISISDEDLKNPNLWFNVINATDNSNSFTIQAYRPTDETTPPSTAPEVPAVYTATVRVIESECEEAGIWGNQWLKSSDDDYFVVVAKDQKVSYKPNIDDLLEITYEGHFLDSTKICKPFYDLNAIPVKLLEVTKK